jgi:hypothetical protein
MDAYGLIYRNTFDPLNPAENLLQVDDDEGSDFQFRLNIHLSDDMTYVLVMTTYQSDETGLFSITVLGTNKVILKRLSKYILEEEIFKVKLFFSSSRLGWPVKIQLVYSSKLTVNSRTYDRDSDLSKYLYEAHEIYVDTNGEYVLWSESSISNTYGYIYKNDFNPLKPFENLLLQHDQASQRSLQNI